MKNALRHVGIVLVSLWLGVCYASCSDDDPVQISSPATIRVSSDGSGDATTIQKALQIAKDGDVIELADGIFTGEGNRDIDFLGKSVTLRSRSGNPEQCVIRLPSFSYPWHRAFVLQSTKDFSPIVEGITIVDGSGGPRPLATQMSKPKAGQSGMSYGGAILCRGGANARFNDCVFVSNNAGIGGVAFCIEDASAAFVGCTFFDNGNTGTGLFVGYDGSFDLERSLIAFNRCTILFEVSQTIPSAILSCCDLYGNSSDWTGSIAPLFGQNGNISKDPLFVNAAESVLWLTENSPCLPDSSACGLIGALGVE